MSRHVSANQSRVRFHILSLSGMKPFSFIKELSFFTRFLCLQAFHTTSSGASKPSIIHPAFLYFCKYSFLCYGRLRWSEVQIQSDIVIKQLESMLKVPRTAAPDATALTVGLWYCRKLRTLCYGAISSDNKP
jgi:hypothetical protein